MYTVTSVRNCLPKATIVLLRPIFNIDANAKLKCQLPIAKCHNNFWLTSLFVVVVVAQAAIAALADQHAAHLAAQDRSAKAALELKDEQLKAQLEEAEKEAVEKDKALRQHVAVLQKQHRLVGGCMTDLFYVCFWIACGCVSPCCLFLGTYLRCAFPPVCTGIRAPPGKC